MNHKDYSLGEADQLEYAYRLPVYSTMELYIETLTGTCFELRVSPYETVISVKAKIQRLEGIPIAQQYLIWQNNELEDEYCLHDYNITDGCTLKLVLAMRGGPINTRRVAMEEPSLREMADYMESNREELFDKLTPPPSGGNSNKQVTLLVYRDGDQLNFFRVVDRGDGTLTPFTESLSGSACNLRDEDEEYDEEYITSVGTAGTTTTTTTTTGGRLSRSPGKQSLSVAQMVENNITAIKMKKLRAQMVNNNTASSSKTHSMNIGINGLNETKSKAAKVSSTPFKDSKLRRELMEKLNLNDDDVAPKKLNDKLPSEEAIPNRSSDDLLVKTKPRMDDLDSPSLTDTDTTITLELSDNTAPSTSTTAALPAPPTPSTDNIVASKKITKAEMLRARFKRLKNIKESSDENDKMGGHPITPAVAATADLDNKSQVPVEDPKPNAHPPTTASPELPKSKSLDSLEQQGEEKDPPKGPDDADTSSETASSSGRFSPRTRRLLNALEHNTNPRRSLPTRSILPKPTANDMMQGLTFNRHDLYLKSYGLIRSPEEDATPSKKDEPPVPLPEPKDIIESGESSGSKDAITSPKVLETQHGVKYSALGGARAPYYWGRYLKSPPVWNSSKPEGSSSKVVEESWHVTAAAASQKHVPSPRVPSGTLKPLADSASAARKSFAAGRKSLLSNHHQQKYNDGRIMYHPNSDHAEDRSEGLRESPKLGVNSSLANPPSSKHVYPHPPASSSTNSWQRQYMRRNSLSNTAQYPSKEDTMSNKKPLEPQLPEEDSPLYLRNRQSRQTPNKSALRMHQTIESPHVESMTKQEAREVVDFINKAVDASILRNLVRSPNKDVNQRGTSGHGSSRYPVPPYHRNSDPGRSLLRSGVSRHAIKQSSPVNNAASPRAPTILPPVKPPSKKKRCFLCGKRTGLATSYMCRCGNNFCAAHRYAETHDCSFDYKAAGRKLLEEANPLVSAPKLPKI